MNTAQMHTPLLIFPHTHVHRCARLNEAHRPVRPRAFDAFLVAGHRVRLMPSRAALLPQIACDSSLPTLFACFYLPRAVSAPHRHAGRRICGRRAHQGHAPCTPCAAPTRAPPRCFGDGVASRSTAPMPLPVPTPGCHAVWRRDASFRSPRARAVVAGGLRARHGPRATSSPALA